MPKLKTNIKPAGKYLIASSETLKCIKIAPNIKVAIMRAEGTVTFSLKKPIKRPRAAKIFKPPTRYTMVSLSP